MPMRKFLTRADRGVLYLPLFAEQSNFIKPLLFSLAVNRIRWQRICANFVAIFRLAKPLNKTAACRGCAAPTLRGLRQNLEVLQMPLNLEATLKSGILLKN